MDSNRKQGLDFERELCETLHQHGFWVHNLAQKAAGQPFDVIAARNGAAHPIDCKVCSNDRFVFSRIEQNQFFAMKSWEETVMSSCWFAVKLSDASVWMIDFASMEYIARTQASIGEKEIRSYPSLNEWIDYTP